MKKIIFNAKITPKKLGQFVSVWKRNHNQLTVPHDENDDFEIMEIILEGNLGRFLFPKQLLLDKNVVSSKNRRGKNGMRVYDPFCITVNKQAKLTQEWQKEYYYPH